jgi:hypothetical protein
MIVSDVSEPHFEPDMLPDNFRKPGKLAQKMTMMMTLQVETSKFVLEQRENPRTMSSKSGTGSPSTIKFSS